MPIRPALPGDTVCGMAHESYGLRLMLSLFCYWAGSLVSGCVMWDPEVLWARSHTYRMCQSQPRLICALSSVEGI
jgi:hypothetical protein